MCRNIPYQYFYFCSDFLNLKKKYKLFRFVFLEVYPHLEAI